ncbi:MAG: CTP synthase [Planctomycetota bacterium]
MAKFIFVTGGVVSSLGKGLTAAALGCLLESRGLKIGIQKLDPYINVDPGTMSPFEHGEVYVTDDGAETDLDLGHYERFTNTPLNELSNFTTGSIYDAVIRRERAGGYLGKTVQVVPHITDEIKSCILKMAEQDLDVVITEIGGTVGDIESHPFLEAIRQFGLEQGRDRVMYLHLTLLPYLRATGEVKTKPTQHSVSKLREIGILPDVLVYRTEVSVDESVRKKISLFCNIPLDAVFEEKDVDHSIYELPLVLDRQGIDDLVMKRLQLSPTKESDLSKWESLVDNIINQKREEVTVGIVGKYIELHDAYKSIYEALDHAAIASGAKVRLKKIEAEDVEQDGAELHLRDVDAVLVPGGFGSRGIEGMITAAQYARENDVPYFGICLGLQIAVIEFARNKCRMKDANSTEFVKDCGVPVIDLMLEQRGITDKGGTMRLGAYPCRVTKGTLAYECYGQVDISERHRHRWELNNKYLEVLEANGMVPSGINPDSNLVEIVELPTHPWFMGVQFHPEFKSKPIQPHGVFQGFVKAAMACKAKKKGGKNKAAPRAASENVE